MHSVLCMVFNHSRDELITGGTGGMKVTDKAYIHISSKTVQKKKSVFISINVGESSTGIPLARLGTAGRNRINNRSVLRSIYCKKGTLESPSFTR